MIKEKTMIPVRFMCLIPCITLLAACSGMNDSVPDYTPYQSYTYNHVSWYSPNTNYSNAVDYTYQEKPQSRVNVPETYHVGAFHSPLSAKDRDRNWVSQQNSQGYTIEIADDEKASQVAKKLYQIPKNEPMAEVNYQRGGKQYYKGLYGSYNSPEEAQKALNALPEDIKKGAGIKNWSNVKSNLGY